MEDQPPDLAGKMARIRECRELLGHQAAAEMWALLGLPVTESLLMRSLQLDWRMPNMRADRSE